MLWIIWEFWENLKILVFSKIFFFIWQNAVRKLQKSESEVFKVNPRFLKIPEGPKMDWKSLNYFPGLADKKLAGITKETLS